VFDGIKRALVLKVLNDVLKDEVKKMPANWKTTLLGILTIAGTVSAGGAQLLHGDTPDWKILLAGITAGWGLIHAKDATTK